MIYLNFFQNKIPRLGIIGENKNKHRMLFFKLSSRCKVFGVSWTS